jgi:hypothetical protein
LPIQAPANKQQDTQTLDFVNRLHVDRKAEVPVIHGLSRKRPVPQPE